jgi:hypothetical protein
MVSNKDDMGYISSTLQQFGDVTSLVTNCTKNQVMALDVQILTLSMFYKLSQLAVQTSQ